MTFRKDVYNKLDREDKKAYATSYDKPLRSMQIVKPSDNINSPKSSTPDTVIDSKITLTEYGKKSAIRERVKKKGAK